jgi:hypothetical protein
MLRAFPPGATAFGGTSSPSVPFGLGGDGNDATERGRTGQRRLDEPR